MDTLLNLLMTGILPVSWLGATAIMLGLTHITILTVTLYLHRSCAHRSVDFPNWLNHFFRFWSWMTTGMTARQWASVHRKHHAKCETTEDPHSPQRLGLAKIFFQGALLYRKTARDPEVIKRYGHGTPDDRQEHFYESWATTGIIAMVIIEIALFGLPKGSFIALCQIIWIPLWAAGFINGVGHYWGYRNYNSADASRNIFPLAFFIGGEELHNNHHAFPSSAKLSCQPWEFDWGWGVLRALSFLRLARIKKVAPQPLRDAQTSSTEITLDHLKTVVACRFDAMRDAKKNLLPLIDKQIAHVNWPARLDKQTFLNWFFFENATAQTDAEQEVFSQITAENPVLAKIRECLLRLIETWTVVHSNTQIAVENFKKWCIDAESSGVDGLAALATTLRSYRLANAMAM